MLLPVVIYIFGVLVFHSHNMFPYFVCLLVLVCVSYQRESPATFLFVYLYIAIVVALFVFLILYFHISRALLVSSIVFREFCECL